MREIESKKTEIDVHSTWSKDAQLKDISRFLLLAAVATTNAVPLSTDHEVFQRVGDKVNLFSPGNLGDRLRVLCGCSVGCSLSRRPVSTFDLSFVTTVTHQTSFSSCVIVILF